MQTRPSKLPPVPSLRSTGDLRERFVGLDVLQRTLDSFGLEGIDLRRGVEDELAYQHGINNRVTARGLVGLLRLIEEERAFSPALSRQMLDILHRQQFRSGIPAGLPR